MSRYIDADLLELPYGYCEDSTECYKALNTLPTIDIVRCGECKHNYNKTLNHGKMYPRCDFTDWKLSENDYCSRGEREGER